MFSRFHWVDFLGACCKPSERDSIRKFIVRGSGASSEADDADKKTEMSKLMICVVQAVMDIYGPVVVAQSLLGSKKAAVNYVYPSDVHMIPGDELDYGCRLLILTVLGIEGSVSCSQD